MKNEVFKEYNKEYEDVFTDPNKLLQCKIERVDPIGIDLNNYIKSFKDVFVRYEKEAYDALVKYIWLSHKFVYGGYKKVNHSGTYLEAAYAIFIRKFIGFDAKVITKNNGIWMVQTYFNDFYPDFDLGNPFEQPYEYPYKHVNLECLTLVHKMPERLSLLQICEDRKMPFLKFLDYVINYISCYNDEHGERVYDLLFTHLITPYVRYNKKDIKKYEGKQKIKARNIRKGRIQ
jgi:hypothetical protein